MLSEKCNYPEVPERLVRVLMFIRHKHKECVQNLEQFGCCDFCDLERKGIKALGLGDDNHSGSISREESV